MQHKSDICSPSVESPFEIFKKLTYTYDYSIPPELCDEIIKYFEEEQYKHPGSTAGGINKNVKDTTDYAIPVNVPPDNKWFKINKLLSEELGRNLKRYYESLKFESGDNRIYNVFGSNKFTENVFQIQRYNKNIGKYVYHNDFSVNFSNRTNRIITYLWYLNDVHVGGETEIWGNIQIKPTKGKLLLFPASWTFPHSGKMPISDDKYIITGWLYSEAH